MSMEWAQITEYSIAPEKASLLSRLPHVSNLGKNVIIIASPFIKIPVMK